MKVGNDHQFSDVFQRYRKRPVAWNSLRDCLQNSLKIKETSPNTFTQIIFRFKQVLGTPLNSFVSFFRLGNFNTVWKVAKYGVFSGPYFPVFGLSKGKYGPEKLRMWTPFTQCNVAIHSNKLYPELSESEVKKLHEKFCDEIVLALLCCWVLTLTDPGFYPRNFPWYFQNIKNKRRYSPFQILVDHIKFWPWKEIRGTVFSRHVFF